MSPTDIAVTVLTAIFCIAVSLAAVLILGPFRLSGTISREEREAADRRDVEGPWRRKR